MAHRPKRNAFARSCSMKISIGADHRGFEHKEFIKRAVKIQGETIEWIDVGCTPPNMCDYPGPAKAVAKDVKAGIVELGVLLCGSGVGVSIVANRFAKVYTALAWSEETAKLAREHDFANILAIPADFVSKELAVTMVQTWLQTEFLEGRHRNRIDMIDAIGGL